MSSINKISIDPAQLFSSQAARSSSGGSSNDFGSMFSASLKNSSPGSGGSSYSDPAPAVRTSPGAPTAPKPSDTTVTTAIQTPPPAPSPANAASGAGKAASSSSAPSSASSTAPSSGTHGSGPAGLPGTESAGTADAALPVLQPDEKDLRLAPALDTLDLARKIGKQDRLATPDARAGKTPLTELADGMRDDKNSGSLTLDGIAKNGKKALAAEPASDNPDATLAAALLASQSANMPAPSALSGSSSRMPKGSAANDSAGLGSGSAATRKADLHASNDARQNPETRTPANVDGVLQAIAPAGAQETRTLDASEANDTSVTTGTAFSQSLNLRGSNATPETRFPASANVATRAGADGWADEVSDRVVFFKKADLQEAELHLNPAELGPMKVSLKMVENQAQVVFTTAHENLRQILQDALPQLRQALSSQGIELGNTSVSTGDGQQQFAGNPGADAGDRRQNRSGAWDQTGGNGMQRVDALTTDQLVASALRTAANRNANGRLDTFA